MSEAQQYYNWRYIEPKGPKLDITKVGINTTPFPYLPDERTEDEIQQDKFNAWQQQYEYEMQNPE